MASVEGVDRTLVDYIAQAAQILGQAAPGVGIRVISGFRSPAAQAELRDRYLRGDRRGIGAEPARNSLHSVGRAVDIQLTYRGQLVPVRDTPRDYWQFLAELLEPVGVRWGGRFSRPDFNHFDL